MSEAEEQDCQQNLGKDSHCYLAWKMDWKFREILNKKTPNYLQHLKTLPSHDATDSIYQRARWSHCNMHPPKIHNFFKKLKGVAENPDWKSDGISDTDSIRTEDFESRFTELLVPAPSIGSESQETIGADVEDGAEIEDHNDIAEEGVLESVSLEKISTESVECSDLHTWKTPDVAKQRYESKLMIPKSFINEEEVKTSTLKEVDIPSNETHKIVKGNASSGNKEMSAKLDGNLDKFRQLPDCSQSKLWCLVNEMQTFPGNDNNQTYKENTLKQKVEQLIAENIKLGAEKALLVDEVKEIKDKEENGSTLKLQKLQDDCNRQRAGNQMLRAKCAELECKLNDQSETFSELTQQNTQYSHCIAQLENNKKVLSDNISKLNTQLEHNVVKITGLENHVKDLKDQLCHEKELYKTQAQEHADSMAILEKKLKESTRKLEIDHQGDLEKLKNASNAEIDALIEKYELRLARQVADQTSQNAIKESQISSLKSKLIKLEFEQECERQKWKQMLVKNDDSSKKKKQGSQQCSAELMDQSQNNNIVSELHQKLEQANKQILNLNTTNQQLCQRIGQLREDLSKLREINKSREEERSWDISDTRDILAQHNQLMIQDLKDKITKEMHVEVLSLMQHLHQQEDELVYIKSMWNKMLKSLHLFECEGNNPTVFNMDKLEILIAGLLNEESHLNMNILGVKYLSRLTKTVCGKIETGKYQSPLADKPRLAQYLQEPIKTAFNRLHTTTQQLRDLVKSLSKNNSCNPSLELYSGKQADSIHCEFPVEKANRENNIFRPFIGMSSTSSSCSANNFDEESQRMIMLECDLNHQAKVLLELMRSYNGLQEALVATHSSLHAQKGMNRKNATE